MWMNELRTDESLRHDELAMDSGEGSDAIADIAFLSATRMAELIREKKLSSREIIEAHLTQIAEHNPALNAIVTLDEDGALQRAKEADEALERGEVWGPLHGVPVTIKDTLETAGLRTTSSFKPLKNHIPIQDATSVAHLRSAGAIILGKTNVPMLASDPQTISPLFGRANNPWDVTRTPGGSTGGGAAAVAAGMSPLEIGSDIGGSLRVPAHYCGIFSLKPTEHRVSTAGHIPELPDSPRGVRHMATIGPVARSVADLRLALNLIAGPDFRDWDVPPLPLESVPARPIHEYRFAWSDDFGGIPVSTDTRSALENLVGQLREAGCQVERRNPPEFDFEEAWLTWGDLFGAEVGSSMPAIARWIASIQYRRWGKGAAMERGLVRGFRQNLNQYIKALTRRDTFIDKMERFLSDWDGWLCPVMATTAPPHRKPGTPILVEGQQLPYSTAAVAHSCIANLTGHPAVSIPISQSSEGLPISVQVIGQRWHEMALLNIADALTPMTGPCQHPPGY